MVAEAKAALESGHAVVIGLQSTGEAAADAAGLRPGTPCALLSTTRTMLAHFLEAHFPTKMAVPAGVLDASGGSEVVVIDEEEGGGGASPAPAATWGQGGEDPELVAAKEGLLARVAALQLPPNFLDLLIDQLGGAKAVAEMTGAAGSGGGVGGGGGRLPVALWPISRAQFYKSSRPCSSTCFYFGNVAAWPCLSP